jgi:hypothetical protein
MNTSLAAPQTVHTITNLGNGLTEEWLHNHQIVVYTLDNYSRATVDTWFTAAFNTSRTYTGPKLCILHDHSSVKAFAPSVYMRSKSTELAQMKIAIPVYVGMIMPSSFISGIVYTLLNIRGASNATFKVFTNRPQALVWLVSKLQR